MVDKGKIETRQTLDETILDRDIIQIIKCEYNIDDNELLAFAEESDKVSEYFGDSERGADVIREHVERVSGGRVLT